MGVGLAKRGSTEVARPLKVLVPLIKGAIAKGDEAGLEYYRQAGEMLLEAKEQVARGEWRAWVERNCSVGYSQATRYMVLAERMIERPARARAVTTLSEVTEPSRATHHRPAWHEPIRAITNRVDVSALAAAEKARAKEKQMTRELGLQLIDIGYKVLVTKLHPDRGGSTEAMTRLNRVRDLLRTAL